MIIWVVVSNIVYFHPYLGKWSNLTNILQMGWHHQLVIMSCWRWYDDILMTSYSMIKIWSEDSTWRIGSGKNLRAKHIGASNHVAPLESGESDRQSTRSSRFLLQIFLKLLVSQGFCYFNSNNMGYRNRRYVTATFLRAVFQENWWASTIRNYHFLIQPSQAALGMVSLKVPNFQYGWVVKAAVKSCLFLGGMWPKLPNR